MPMDAEARARKIEQKLKRAQDKVRQKERRRQDKEARRRGRMSRKSSDFRKGTEDMAEGLMQTLKALMEYTREQIEHNIRLQLIVAFGACFVMALIVFYSTLQNYGRLDDRKYLDYAESVQQIEKNGVELITLLEGKYGYRNMDEIDSILDDLVAEKAPNARYYILDMSGAVLATNDEGNAKAFDFHSLVREVQTEMSQEGSSGRYSMLLSVQRTDPVWLLYRDEPQGQVKYRKAGNLAGLMAVLQGTAVFILMFYIVSKRKMAYIQQISSGVGIIARGELAHRVPERGKDELFILAKSINHMSRSLKDQIEAERAAEKSKQELITNVSHDLRTPLTSVLGYLKLVIDKRYDSPEQMEEYLQTVYNKSEKLRVLIDDLFDYTKLTYSGVGLERVRISLNELVQQMTEEYIPVLEENRLEIKLGLPAEEAWCLVDPQKIHRVLENLLSNAVKYSDKPGDITVTISRNKQGYDLTMDNPAKDLDGVDLSKIFDRFYRLDASRSSDTGGSGLGLGIAKGIVEAHGGTIGVLYDGGRVAFKVWLPAEF